MSLRQRDPPLADEGYLAAIRRLPCCVCGRQAPSEPAHIKMASLRMCDPDVYGKRDVRGGERASDRWAVPLCGPVMFKISKPLPGCHAEQHSMNEEAFWRSKGKNPFMIADHLYQKFGTVESARKSRYRKPTAKIAPQPKTTRPTRKIANRPFAKGKRKFGQ